MNTKPTPGSYVVKLTIAKNGKWTATVVGRWKTTRIAGHTGEEMVDASPTTVEAVRSWAALRLP